jgi:hypothetical protein
MVNMDIDKARRARMRQGTKSYYANECHSLFATKDYMLIRYSDSLYRVSKDEKRRAFRDGDAISIGSPILSGLDYKEPMSFALNSEGWVFFVDSSHSGCIPALGGGTVLPWAPEPPSAPTVSVIDGGGGFEGPGQVKVCATLVDAYGRESGSAAYSKAEVSTRTRFAVSVGNPGASYRVYATDTNGKEYYQVQPGTVGGIEGFGKQCRTRHKHPVRKGQHVVFWMNRLVVADEHVLMWTDSATANTSLQSNAIFMDDAIKAVIPVEGGLCVVAETVYFLDGRDPMKFVQTDAYDARAVPGTLEFVRGSRLSGMDNATGNWAVWMTNRGVLACGPSGQMANLTESKWIFPGYDRGASLVRTDRGNRSVLYSLYAENIEDGRSRR